MKKQGSITVTDNRIVVVMKEMNGQHTSSTYNKVSVESLEDAARVLGLWMELPSEDPARECQRVHNRDQFRAMLRDDIERCLGEPADSSPDWDNEDS